MYLKHEHPPSVSASEIAVWKQCKQKWYWQYFLRLEPSVTHTKLAQGTMAHAGIAAALAGKNVHAAVQQSACDLQRDLQFTYEGVGLDIESADAEVDTVSACVNKWHDESDPLKQRELIWSEMAWEQPIVDGKRKLIGVTWNGRMDATINFMDTSWGFEAKYVGQFRSEESVELSSQLAMYLCYMQTIGVSKLLYLQILNKMPAIPNVNKTGGISRSQINTDWDTYRDTVLANGYSPADYEDMCEKLIGKTFWREQVVTRSPERLAEDRAALYDVSIELLAKRKRIYMCDSPFLCKSCQFRDLCLETVRGRDPQNLVESEAFISRDKPQDDAEVTADAE